MGVRPSLPAGSDRGPGANNTELSTTAFDLLFQGATLVDGTGAPRRTADVGVRDGKIVAIGKLGAGAARTVAADGVVLAPGFIDGHTHMDAQVAWDPLGSCSCWHGVTSVFMGNCGFALAPCKPDEREWIARCLETDLPGGARRLVQKAEGIAMTVVNGAVTLEDGEATGNHPGAVLRGPLWDGTSGV